MPSRLIRSISLGKYNKWFDNNYSDLKGRSPFHHPAWLEAAARGVQFEIRFIGVYEDGELTTVVPGFLTRQGPLRLFGSPLRGTMTSYLGPVSLKPVEFGDELVELITSTSQFVRNEWGAVSSRFTMRDAPPGDKPELSVNWHCQRPGSYRLDISKDIDEIWKDLKYSCRRNIRKAQQAGIEVFPLDDARLYYKMIDNTLKRHGTTSWHKERFFQSLLSELIPRDLLWAWGARYKGNVIAGALFFHDDREVHHISGGSLPLNGSMPTSYLLHWSAIEKASQSGFKVYNSDASRVLSIDRFKESFRMVRERRLTLMWAPRYIRYIQNIFISSYSNFRKLNSRVGISKEQFEAWNS